MSGSSTVRMFDRFSLKPGPQNSDDGGEGANWLTGVPTVILGPGPAHMAHQMGKWCECARVDEAAAIYEALIRSWCGIAS